MSDPRRYLVVFEHSDGTGYSAWVPDPADRIAAVNSREECEQLIREAIVLHLKGCGRTASRSPSHHPWTRRS